MSTETSSSLEDLEKFLRIYEYRTIPKLDPELVQKLRESDKSILYLFSNNKNDDIESLNDFALSVKKEIHVIRIDPDSVFRDQMLSLLGNYNIEHSHAMYIEIDKKKF